MENNLLLNKIVCVRWGNDLYAEYIPEVEKAFPPTHKRINRL